MHSRFRAILLMSVALIQTAIGVVIAVSITVTQHVSAAPVNHNIRVGPGFTDVSPHQIVRTFGDVLYAFVPTCDAPPGCSINTLLVYKANPPGSQPPFSEMDGAHRPAGDIGSSAAAIDANDTIHVVWNDRAGVLNYRTFSTSSDSWSATTVLDPTTNWTTFSQGDEGVALALDANGVPHVAYTDIVGGARHVSYVNRVGGAWSSPTTIDNAPFGLNQGAWHPTLAFYPNGDLLLAWSVGSFNYTPDGTIFFRTRDHTSGTWGTRDTIAGDKLMTTIDNGPSLLITADGTAHVTFLNAGTAGNGSSATGDYIHYYYNSGAGWTPNHPGGGTQITHDPSLGPGPNGGVRIYGHGWQGGSIDGHGNDLNYFEGGGGGAAWGAWTLYVSGSYDSSVTTRWAQFFQSHPEELDIAYWSDASPNVVFVGTDVLTSVVINAAPPSRPGGGGGGIPGALPSPRISGTAKGGVVAPLPPRRS